MDVNTKIHCHFSLKTYHVYSLGMTRYEFIVSYTLYLFHKEGQTFHCKELTF